MEKIIILASVVTGIGALILLLLSLFGNVSADWPYTAAMACVIVGCIVNLIRMKKK